MSKHLPAVFFTVIVACIVTCNTATATVLVPLDFPELVAQSDRVFVGVVSDVVSEASTDGSGALTRAVFQPTSHVKGPVTGDPIVVEKTGGPCGDVVQVVCGSPDFTPGETALMFVRQTGRGTYWTVGMMQGKFAVRNGVVARNRRPLDEVAQALRALAAGRAASLPTGDLADEPTVGTRYIAGDKWQYTTPIPFYVNTTGSGASGALTAVQNAFLEWNPVSRSKFQFQYGGTTTNSGANYDDGQNVVSWTTLPPEYSGAIALATWWISGQGWIVQCDTQFDISESWSASAGPSAYDIQNVGAHEAGHWLSLGDLFDTQHQWKTMYSYCAWSETIKRTLHRDDMDGIASLYPAAISVSYTGPTPTSVEVGETVSLQVTVTNTSSYPIYDLWLDVDILSPTSQKVENTKTPVADPDTGHIGLIDFGSAQGLTLAAGGSRTFTASYTFDTSVTAHDYAPGAYQYKFAAWADGYPGKLTEDAWEISTAVGAIQNRPLTITQAPTGIAGQVRVRGTTTNIAGATVKAYLGGVLKGSAVTAANGLYTIPDVPPGEYVVSAAKAGYVTQTKAGITVNLGETAYVNFGLEVSGALMGQVREWGTTTNIPNATVSAYLGGQLQAVATTDSRGIYSIAADLPAGSYTVSAAKADYRTQTKGPVSVVASDTSYVNFSLEPYAPLKGQVKDSATGLPLAGAAVNVYDGDTWVATTLSQAPYGIYSFGEELPAGTYKISASRDGYVRQTKWNVVVTGGATAYVNFALGISGTLKGQVKDAALNAPLPGAAVDVFDYGAVWASGTSQPPWGIYEIKRDLAAGLYLVRASKQGYVRQYKWNIGVTPGATTFLNFNLQPSGGLMGQVKDKVSGTPIVGATVKAYSGGLLWATATTTAPYGVYYIDSDLPAGTFTVQASKAGYLPQTKAGIAVTAGATSYANFFLLHE
ncbi:MAG: carboxypeptidase regulatory-like domain-containing protein [Armatimonadota bacterium]|nr:MAG: carboxypeptidase regulatory-like domain-containing protein [Armatimonadota bacterium]